MDIKKVQTVGVVVLKDKEVLLVENGSKSSHINGTYGLPAGKVDFGETHKQAAVRELQEETGLVTREDFLVPLKIFEATITQKSGPVHFIWHTFLCTSYSGTPNVTEETIPRWVSLEELKNIKNLLPNVEAAVTLGIQVFE
ncbi:MAG: NUDIX domain-containing protein [bacterium]|nr:NUDIX domain-containing protein [bacterium]